jgi:anti-anti-sigma regulatory factor
VLSCRHLTSGADPRNQGRFYARCGIGNRDQRLAWLARVGPVRLERVRELQSEFDSFSRPYREELFAAKARAVALPGEVEHRIAVEQLTAGFLVAVEGFLARREEAFDEVGLATGPLLQLIREWSWAWARSRELANDRFSEDPLLPFAPEPSGAPGAPRRRRTKGRSTEGFVSTHEAGQGENRIYADEMLRISRTEEPPGLSFQGDIDASNLHAVAQSLALAAVAGGDFHVDFGGLRFCDLGGFGAIVRAAQSLGANRRLIVHGMPGHLQRAMSIVGWTDLPTMVIRPALMAEGVD